MTQWRLYDNPKSFLHEQTQSFLSGYQRNLLQTQPIKWELWIEKDALSDLCERVAGRYGIPVVIAKGYASMSFKFELRDRILDAWDMEHRPTGIIYMGDFDPSGMDMLPAMTKTLFEEMEIPYDSLATIRCALNPDHIAEYKLPYSPDAVKRGDSRAKAFIKKYGVVAVELDALEPAIFMDVLEKCIQENIDTVEFENQKEIHDTDTEKIWRMRKKALAAIKKQ